MIMTRELPITFECIIQRATTIIVGRPAARVITVVIIILVANDGRAMIITLPPGGNQFLRLALGCRRAGWTAADGGQPVEGPPTEPKW